MSSNDVRDKGAQQIAPSRKDNVNLANIGLSNNEIGNSGAEALAENLPTTKKIPCTRTASCFPSSCFPFANGDGEDWRSYIRGNVMSEYGARIIQTIPTVVSGTGKLEHDEEGGDGGRNLRKDWGTPGHRLSVSDVQQTLSGHHKNKAAARDGIANKIATRIESAMQRHRGTLE